MKHYKFTSQSTIACCEAEKYRSNPAFQPTIHVPHDGWIYRNTRNAVMSDETCPKCKQAINNAIANGQYVAFDDVSLNVI